MAEQTNEENIVFLPWTVESQPQTQAVILQQPSETHLRLDATTDKTAIASFVAATVVGIIAAIWYGRKSFDLTKQSFDAVMAQIKSSEQVALDLNKKLFEQQKELQSNDLVFKKESDWKHQLRAVSSDYQISLTMFIYKSQYFENNLLSSQNGSRNQCYNEIVMTYEDAIKHLVKLDLFFDPNNNDLDKVIHWADMFSVIANGLLITRIMDKKFS